MASNTPASSRLGFKRKRQGGRRIQDEYREPHYQRKTTSHQQTQGKPIGSLIFRARHEVFRPLGIFQRLATDQQQ